MAYKKTSTDKILLDRLDKALDYLSQQEDRLKPFITELENILLDSVKRENISVDRAFEMFLEMQKQYTDSILLMTKIKEIMRYR
jgi:hypothetical protein